MTVKEITAILEELAPLPLAEDFDNVGLLTGHNSMEVEGVLVTLDALESVVDDALERGCNLIVSFHPILFKGLKRLTGADYVERALLKAVKNDIAIYSMHTALDNVPRGVSGRLSQALGLQECRILMPRSGTIEKLVTYVPLKARDAVLDALFQAGAGALGNYSHCSFGSRGEGSFLPEPGARPSIGVQGELHREPEEQLHLTYPSHLRQRVLDALMTAHQYEEVAYEISALENQYQHTGMGMLGLLASPMEGTAFLELLKKRLGTPCIRHSELPDKRIHRVAVLGGSGAFAIDAARKAGADALVTADLKYHQFYQAEGALLLADVGHYESEQFTKNLIHEYLTEKIPNFAIHLSEVKTNPVNYY